MTDHVDALHASIDALLAENAVPVAENAADIAQTGLVVQTNGIRTDNHEARIDALEMLPHQDNTAAIAENTAEVAQLGDEVDTVNTRVTLIRDEIVVLGPAVVNNKSRITALENAPVKVTMEEFDLAENRVTINEDNIQSNEIRIDVLEALPHVDSSLVAQANADAIVALQALPHQDLSALVGQVDDHETRVTTLENTPAVDVDAAIHNYDSLARDIVGASIEDDWASEGGSLVEDENWPAGLRLAGQIQSGFHTIAGWRDTVLEGLNSFVNDLSALDNKVTALENAPAPSASLPVYTDVASMPVDGSVFMARFAPESKIAQQGNGVRRRDWELVIFTNGKDAAFYYPFTAPLDPQPAVFLPLGWEFVRPTSRAGEVIAT